MSKLFLCANRKTFLPRNRKLEENFRRKENWKCHFNSNESERNLGRYRLLSSFKLYNKLKAVFPTPLTLEYLRKLSQEFTSKMTCNLLLRSPHYNPSNVHTFYFLPTPRRAIEKDRSSATYDETFLGSHK